LLFYQDKVGENYIVYAEDYDHFLSNIKSSILNDIETRRFQGDGYFYVLNSTNLRLIMHPYSDQVGKLLADETAFSGIKLYQKLLQVAQVNENGDFLRYQQKLKIEKPGPEKLVYARIYKDWNWLIASDIDLVEIEKTALQKQDEMQNIININIVAITVVLLLFILIIFFYFQTISRKLKRSALIFTELLRQALHKDDFIPIEQLPYTEFSEFTESVNVILQGHILRIEKLQDNLQFFQLLTQKIRTAIYTFGMDGKFIYVNPAMEEITGYSKKELNEMKFWELVHPDFRELVKKRGMNRLQGKNEVSSYTFKIKRKDGNSSWIEIANTKTSLGGKQIVLGTGNDISERKQALQNLTTSEEKYRNLIETMEEGVLVVDAEENVTFANPAAARIFETTTQVMLQSNFRDFTSKKTYEKLLEYTERRRQGKIDKYEFEVITAKNNNKILQTKATPLIHNGEYHGSFGVMIDVTERYKYEKELEKKNRELKKLKDSLQQEVKRAVAEVRDKDHMLMKQSRQTALGDMLSNIAHQWRQPLAAVAAIIQNFDDAYEEGEMDAAYLDNNIDKVLDIITGLSNTIDHFRSFFKPNKQKNKFNVCQVLNKLLKFTKETMREADIKIKTNLQQDCYVYAYENEFSQVVMNILLNARDIFQERQIDKREIIINVYKKSTEIVIEIVDNAGGIEPDILDRIFDPYFSTKKTGQDTGLGLYMAKMIIEQNLEGSLAAANWENGAKFIISVKAYEQSMRENY
jgi:PAS domain S-box-containing protein